MSLERLKILDPKDPFFNELLKKVVQRVGAIEIDAKILIFGSFLTNHFTAESDLDLVVILPNHWKQKIFLEKLYDGRYLSSWPLDILIFTQKQFDQKKEIGGICFEAAHSGIEIYPNWSLHGTFS